MSEIYIATLMKGIKKTDITVILHALGLFYIQRYTEFKIFA